MTNFVGKSNSFLFTFSFDNFKNSKFPKLFLDALYKLQGHSGKT